MGDLQLWKLGLQGAERVLAGLEHTKMLQLSDLLNDYREQKKALAGVILPFNSEITCRECSGQCCLNGKYRLNVLDLISLVAGNTLVAPDFEQKPVCPYGAVSGCLLESGFRPADCILFICDAIEDHLSDSARLELATREKKLRELMKSASSLLAVPVATPLLLWSENNCISVNS